MKKKILKLIDEYAGPNFRFLIDFLDGNFENYVEENLESITHKKVYGSMRIRSEYKKMNGYVLKQRILQICEDTLEYIKNSK